MPSSTDLLEKFYNSFINFDDPKNFFIGLCDYIDFIESVPEFEGITNNLLNQFKVVETKLEGLNKVAVVKLKEVHKELADYIQQNKVDRAGINEALKEYDGWLNGHIVGSMSLAEALHDNLSDIIQFLNEIPEHKDFVSKYLVLLSDKVHIRHYLMPQEVKDYFDFLEEARAQYKNELWGRMNDVIRYCKIIKKGRETRKELVKDGIDNKNLKATYELISSHDILYGEWMSIQEGRLTRTPVFFNVKEIKPIISRFHIYLLKEISLAENKALVNEINEEIERVKSEPNNKNIADQINENFERDRQNIQISRAWFEAISNSIQPQLEAYQTYVAQTLINLQPFRRKLEENAKLIKEISTKTIMPNLEAVKPMLSEIEKSLDSVKKLYAPPQRMTITSPLPPRMKVVVENNELTGEVRALREKVEELTQNQEYRIVVRQPQSSGMTLPELPKDLKWEEITIQFFNNQDVLIKTRGKILNTNFEGMGFMDKKKRLPNKQWELLVGLSKRNGEMSWQNNRSLSKKDIDAIKKRKQLLSDALKKFFQIKNSPFADYARTGMYRIKINLVPESAVGIENPQSVEINEYLGEIAPEINDQE